MASSSLASSSSSIFARRDGTAIQDEYDPMRPNDYEEVRCLCLYLHACGACAEGAACGVLHRHRAH